MKTGYHRLALQEFHDAAQHYEDESAGLGDQFIAEVERNEKLVAMFRSIGNLDVSGKRIVPLDRFPYSLVYEVRADEIFIAAVMHQHREPYYWIDRL